MRRVGYAAVSAAAVLWAIGGAYASDLIDRGASVVELTEARSWIAVAGMGLILAVRRGRGTGEPAPGWLAVPFGLSIAASNFLYYASLSRIPVAVAITVQYTAPGLVVLYAAVVGRRRPSGRVLGALMLAFGGVALLAELPHVASGGGFRLDRLGFAAAATSAFSFATYMLLGERLGRSLGSEAALFRAFAVSSVFWVAVQLTRGRPDTLLDPTFVPGIVFLAVATTIAPFLLFLWGLERVDASRAAIVSTLEPLTAALIAYVWLRQTLSGMQLAGAVMVIGGIAIVQLERPQSAEVLAERAAVE